MQAGKDPMGSAIADYHATGKAARLRVFSPMFDEDDIPVATLFRRFDEMPAIEQEALRTASGAILDVGAGAGCHSLALQAMEKRVTAIDISPLAVATMRERGVKEVLEQDFFTLEGRYDTILMLMNGIGIVGTLRRLPDFFLQVDRLLAPGGQLLCDSSDICYIFEDEDLARAGSGPRLPLRCHCPWRALRLSGPSHPPPLTRLFPRNKKEDNKYNRYNNWAANALCLLHSLSSSCYVVFMVMGLRFTRLLEGGRRWHRRSRDCR